MSATPISSSQMTLEEYLEFDYNSEGRFEYFDGEVFELSGGSPEHALLSSQIGYLLRRELLPKGCLVYSSDLKIKVPSLPPYRYADVTALCDKPIYEKLGNIRYLVNPVLLVEVLSSSMEKYYRSEKLIGYKSISSFREYLLVSQNQKLVIQYVKHNKKFWLQTEYGEG
ncbi:MAG TPA: Uma2 family endonuclease [Pyrinomonadaceae bacterium]|jgi:Uma2 family endonuclease